MKKNKTNKINMKRYFQVLGISLAVLLVVVLGVLGFNVWNLDLSGENGLTQAEIATVEASGGKVNVLAMGVDIDGLRTDAIMLITYDTEANTVKALSIPRDTRMYVGSKYQKINAAHAITGSNGKPLGAQGTVEAVSRLTNVPINYYIEFSFTGIEKCMDALGPVEFEIPDLNGDGVGMVYDDPVQDLHISLKPGLQELDGEQIVHLLRYRKGNLIKGVRRTYANGDIDRIAVQQDFIKALVDQKLNASLVLKIPSIFKSISDELKTNLTAKDVLKYSKYLANLSSSDVSIYSLPGNFSGGEYNASYWICDIDATRELIETEFGYDASSITVDKSAKEKTADNDKKSTNSSKKSSSSSSTKSTAKPTQKVSSSDDDDTVKTSSSKTSKATTKATAKATQKASSSDDDKNTDSTVSEKKENHVPQIKDDGGEDDEENVSDNAEKTETKATPKPTAKATQAPTKAPVAERTPSANSVPQKKEE